MSRAEDAIERTADFLRAIPGAAEKASAAALNRAVVAGREQAIESILGRYAAKGSDVRTAITTRPARKEDLSADVIAKSGSLSLGYFPHTPISIGTGGPGKPPLTVEILRGSVRTIPGAFVAPINGKPRIMIRTGGTTKTGRTQIKSVPAVPIAVMMGNEGVRDAVERRAVDVLDEQLGKQIDKALAGAA